MDDTNLGELADRMMAKEEDELLSELGTIVQCISIDRLHNAFVFRESELQQSRFLTLALTTEKVTSQERAAILREAYRQGSRLAYDDRRRIGRRFLDDLLKEFKQEICRSFFQDKGTSPDQITTIIPAVIAAVGIPAPYNAAAIPIAIILFRIGLRRFCMDYLCEDPKDAGKGKRTNKTDAGDA